MKIDTPNLIMTQITEGDWPLFLRLQTEKDIIELCFDAPDTDKLREKFISRLSPWQAQDSQWLTLVIVNKRTGEQCGITGFVIDNGVAEVGYMLLPEFHGNGIGTESLRAVINWATQQHRIAHYQAVVTAGNIASECVLKKCGFELKEILPNAYQIGNSLYDDHIYRFNAVQIPQFDPNV
ncbi:GNAT family N-acetyltransferase [Vibrio profundum]|uniref:GNAT family N-acetyltransferase n=1 Tax=Vibrio profundum TaxID=2910247 RepID=UPI003D0B1EC5